MKSQSVARIVNFQRNRANCIVRWVCNVKSYSTNHRILFVYKIRCTNEQKVFHSGQIHEVEMFFADFKHDFRVNNVTFTIAMKMVFFSDRIFLSAFALISLADKSCARSTYQQGFRNFSDEWGIAFQVALLFWLDPNILG